MNTEKNRPNIILIMVESWDGKVIGNYGDPAIKNITPNIEAFAREGVQFKCNYTSHPICCPARANLWSGQYTHHCKSWNNYKGLQVDDPILPDVLKKKGNYVFAGKKIGIGTWDYWKRKLRAETEYRKSAKSYIGIGKHDYLSGDHTHQNRITAWTGAANIRLPAYTEAEPKIHPEKIKRYHKKDWERAEQANEFLEKQVKRQKTGKKDPFFLYLSLTTPHPRFNTSQYWMDKVDYDKVSIPPKDEEDHPVIEYQKIQKDWRWGLDDEHKKRTRAIYYAMIAETDAFIGEVLDQVHALGLDENTYIIITADHGENNMEHDLFYKMNMYESSVNIPLLIKGPGIRKGIMSDKIVSLIDLYPTMLNMAGLTPDDAPKPLDGESILPYLRGETDITRDWAFSIFTGTAVNTSLYMLRKGDWKYIAYVGYEPQLFNLKDDPDEIKNYAKAYTEIVKEMDAKLREVCNYDAVHKEWQQYCKNSFRKYREHVKNHPTPLYEYGAKILRAKYPQIISNTYKGWTEKHAQQLENWLNADP